MSSKPILYHHIFSPAVRAVLLTAAAIGIELDLKEVILSEKQHLSPEYLKMNPQHTIPTLDDMGTIIVDSHVICGYLADKYGHDDKLYPKDIVKRAEVNARLFFNACNVFARMRFLSEPIMFGNETEIDEWKVKYIEKNWEVIDRFVSETPYVCGNDMTIADLCLIASISSFLTIIKIDRETYPNLTKWIERMQQLPYYKEKNEVGASLIPKIFADSLERNRKQKLELNSQN